MATHPLRTLLAQVAGMLADGHDLSLIGLDQHETAQALLEVQRLTDQAASLRAQVLGHADHVGVDELDGSKSAAHWLAHHARLATPTTVGDLTFAQSLGRHPQVADQFSDGVLNTAQARVITQALDNLPAHLDAETTHRATSALLGYATEYRPRELAVLGRRILHVLDPQLADQEDARILAQQEAAAWDNTRATLRDDGEGTTHLHATMPTATGQMLRKALLAYLTSGKATGHAGARATGQSLALLIESLDPDHLPTAGGTNATVVVTIDADKLAATTGTALLDTGTSITASQARMYACTAQILPAVLGGKSEPLDLGRRQRLFSKAQRTALAVRDQGCTVEGCDQPPSLCHAHHNQPWSTGGPTNLTNARLLCAHHHRRIHDPRYTTETRPGNQIRLTRRRE